MKNQGKTLTTAELAERWGLNKATLGNWRSQGKGPKYIKMGTQQQASVLYRLDDVIEYEEQFLISPQNKEA